MLFLYDIDELLFFMFVIIILFCLSSEEYNKNTVFQLY